MWPTPPSVFLGTDAEKAFDRVNWRFMFAVLCHIGLGDKIHWIASIYCTQSAQVKANGILSDPFPIYNGTRQECPLSPLLFALSLELYLCKIRLNPDIKGVTVGNSQHKILAYTDDMLFSITNPVVFLPNLLHEFKVYGQISNLKINFGKSEAMGVEIPPPLLRTLKSNFGFPMDGEGPEISGDMRSC